MHKVTKILEFSSSALQKETDNLLICSRFPLVKGRQILSCFYATRCLKKDGSSTFSFCVLWTLTFSCCFLSELFSTPPFSQVYLTDAHLTSFLTLFATIRWLVQLLQNCFSVYTIKIFYFHILNLFVITLKKYSFSFVKKRGIFQPMLINLW